LVNVFSLSHLEPPLSLRQWLSGRECGRDERRHPCEMERPSQSSKRVGPTRG
jgi:hypothetical protein